jgi:tetratricopeptide (TPR) repeat protein
MVITLREEAAMEYIRSLIFVLTVLVGMIAAPAYPADELFDSATASKHMDQGIAFLKAKDFDAAVNEFNAAAEIAPEAEAYYYLGYAYYMKSRKVDGDSRRMSKENFEQAYEIDPNFSPTRYKPAEPAPQQAEPSATAEPVIPQPDVQQPPTPEQPKP